MKHLGDIQKINGDNVSPVHIIVGGSPCQDLSVAGLKAGMKHESNGDGETTRSGLAYDMFRIIREMRDNVDREAVKPVRYPRYALWENVPGALSAGAADGGKGTAFQVVLTEFIRAKEGCREAPIVPIPKDGWPHAGAIIFADGTASLAWRVIDLQFFGCPQRRKRISLLCDYDGLSAPSIVFEQYPGVECRRDVPPVGKGLSGNPDEGRTEREEAAGAVEESPDGHT